MKNNLKNLPQFKEINLFKIGSILFIPIFVIILWYININNFYNTYYNFLAKINFDQWDYENAIKYLKKIDTKKISEWNNQIHEYNIWNIYYKKWEFKDAQNSYSWITYKDIELKNYHNLGNVFYRKWEKENVEEKIKEWQRALDSYEIAINSDNTDNKEETIKNYEFIKEKLDKLKEEQKKKEEEENKKDNKSKKDTSENWDNWEKNNNSWSWSKEKEEKDKIDSKQWTNAWQFNSIWQKNWEEKWWKEENLSQEEKNELNDYSDFLKQFQKENLQYLQNGKNPSSLFDNFWNDMRNDPFFKNEIVWEWEKDW